jgi:hypothetical protein
MEPARSKVSFSREREITSGNHIEIRKAERQLPTVDLYSNLTILIQTIAGLYSSVVERVTRNDEVRSSTLCGGIFFLLLFSDKFALKSAKEENTRRNRVHLDVNRVLFHNINR